MRCRYMLCGWVQWVRVWFAEGGGWGAGAGSRGRRGGVSVEKFLLSEEQEDSKRVG